MLFFTAAILFCAVRDAQYKPANHFKIKFKRISQIENEKEGGGHCGPDEKFTDTGTLHIQPVQTSPPPPSFNTKRKQILSNLY